MVVGSNPVAVTSTLDIAPVSSEKFRDIQTIIEGGFTLKHVHDMISYNERHFELYMIWLCSEIFFPYLPVMAS